MAKNRENMNKNQPGGSIEEFSRHMMDKYGPFVGGKELRKLLGFQTYDSFRLANHRGLLPVRVFELPNRQGKFALTEDVAQWLYGTIQQIREER